MHNEIQENFILVVQHSMWNLRAKVVTALLEEVNWKQGKDAAGDEFEKTLLAQTTLETYFNAYTDALSDRREMITDIVSLGRGLLRIPTDLIERRRQHRFKKFGRSRTRSVTLGPLRP
jgi:hypothetical protein